MIGNKLNLNNLLIYRNILDDEIIKKIQFIILEQNCSQDIYYELYSKLINKAEQLHISGNILKNYLIYLITKDENIFSKTIEKTGKLNLGSSLYKVVLHDLKIIKEFINNDLNHLYKEVNLEVFKDFRPASLDNITSLYHPEFNEYFSIEVEELMDKLIEYYSCYGSGITSDFVAFRWNDAIGLTGIKNYDTIRLQDIVGYEQQQQILIQNTISLLEGKPSNNILLIGSPGTGKSSSVKALVNEYAERNLRIVEVSKYELKSLNTLMKILRTHCQKFIIFLDDLSFEEFEVEYKHLKSIIDGGIEVKPENVLIYATSNRMHLVKETWDDRKGTTDDVHRFDTVNEKLSLAARFGITLTYLSPNQQEYLNIIKYLALKNNIDECFEVLKMEALKWERQHNGCSGRTAQQFINHFLSQQ